jgi:nucleoid DNA-binding protein
MFPESGGQAMTRTGKAVTRVDLYEAVYQKVGLSRTESSSFVELVLMEITDCLEKGETVKLSSFGSFMVRKKGQRMPQSQDRQEGAYFSASGDGVQALGHSETENQRPHLR